MAKENPTWGQRRVAAELYLKLSILVSPRTVRKYWPWGRDDDRGKRVSSQRWAIFVRNHADAMVACDFMVAVTAKFQLLYVFVILELDRDCIFSTDLDQELVQGFGVKVLKTPPQSPKRECLDFMIPLNERHLRRLLSEWVRHYNAGRPHSSPGPGIPAEGHCSPVERDTICTDEQRKLRVISRPVLGELHHEYAWENRAA